MRMFFERVYKFMTCLVCFISFTFYFSLEAFVFICSNIGVTYEVHKLIALPVHDLLMFGNKFLKEMLYKILLYSQSDFIELNIYHVFYTSLQFAKEGSYSFFI